MTYNHASPFLRNFHWSKSNTMLHLLTGIFINKKLSMLSIKVKHWHITILLFSIGIFTSFNQWFKKFHSYLSLTYNYAPFYFFCLMFQLKRRVKVQCQSLASSFPYFSFTIFVKEWHIIMPHILFSPKRSIFS
jgi:hypothetical protein